MKRIGFLILALHLVLNYSCIKPKESSTNSDAPTAAIIPDTLPFTITSGNNIVFKSVLNKKDTLDFYFDTGGTELVLTHNTIKSKTSLLAGKSEAYIEEDYAPLEGLHSLSLNQVTWDSLTIYPTTVGPKEADGHFGWNLFDDKIVEIDYEKQLMVIHTNYSGDLSEYSKLRIEYINTLFCVVGAIKVGGQEYPNRYLFDSGFQRAVILDKNLREKANFPSDLPVIKESRLRNAAGTEFVNQIVAVDQICFGETCANQVPVQLLSTPNPAKFETHILGNELLKRFNTILDFQNGFVFLKPNTLMGLPYQDSSSS